MVHTETPHTVDYRKPRLVLNMTSMVKLTALQTAFTGVPAIFTSPCQQLASPFVVNNSTTLHTFSGDPIPSCITL